jgi:hypothetical protein
VVVAAGLVGWTAYSRSVSAAPDPAAPAATPDGGRVASASQPPTTASSGGAATPPVGSERHEVTAASSGTAAGFAIAAPAAWRITRQGLATYLKPPAGSAFIEINLAPFTYPRPLREAAFLQAQATLPAGYPGYRLIGLWARTFLGAPDAVWRFSWDQGGVGRVSVLELLATENAQPYALILSAPSADFPVAAAVFRRALHTFQPLP